MATTKITQLPGIHSITANTSNTIFVAVDVASGTTGKISANVVADGLFSYNPLKVGTDPIQLPNTIGQFTDTSNSYIQVNLKNQNDHGTADYIVTANTGSDTSYYIDLGYTNNLYDTANAFNGLGTSIETLSGYLYVQGGDYATGNLVIGTTVGGTETRFLAGGINSQNVVAKITESGLRFVNNKGIIFSDGTQLTSNTPLATLSNNLNTANTWLQANDAVTLATAKSYTDTANNFIQSHYFANTSGTFGGNLTIAGNTVAHSVSTGNLVVVGTTSISGTANLTGQLNVTGPVAMNSTLILANSNFNSTESALTIKATANVQTPSNDGYMLHISGKQDVPSRIVFDSFGANTYGLISGRTARGTVDAPQAVQSGDVLLRMSGNGWGTTGFAPLGIARIDIVATETYTDAQRGSQIKFYNVPNGSNTLQNIATFNGDSAIFTGVVNPQKGFAYTPNNITSTSTSYTLDFARDSMTRMSINDNTTITLQNYVSGKIIEVWITNSAAQNKTITHGCLANNSTSKLTTFTIASNSCAFLKYFSIDGDQSNTFVSITA